MVERCFWASRLLDQQFRLTLKPDIRTGIAIFFFSKFITTLPSPQRLQQQLHPSTTPVRLVFFIFPVSSRSSHSLLMHRMFSSASQFGISNSVFVASNASSPPSFPLPEPFSVSSTTTPVNPTSDSHLRSIRDEIASLVESELYARLLLPRKKGYPLWKPRPDEHLPEEYRRIGVRIGDIGILNDSGGFDYLFNGCLPADHPINIGRVPEGFKQLQVSDSDTTGSTREYEPGSCVASDIRIFKTRMPNLPGHPQIPYVIAWYY